MLKLDWLTEVKGKDRTLSGFWAILYSCAAIFMASLVYVHIRFRYCFDRNQSGLLSPVYLRSCLPAVSGFPLGTKTRPSVYDIACVLLISVSIGYWINQYMDYAMFRVTEPSTWDLVMGIIAIAMILETARRALGPIMMILAIIFIGQIYFGPYLPGKLSHAGMPPGRIIEFTFSTQEAMFGVITATFATFVFPFMVFGAFLERSGAGTFFMELAKALTGKWRGGPAKIAIVTSALFGSISGSSVANVVATGTFTIPMMKRIGFRPKVAGAIEAIASTGGQFMPPIMGAGVFILATLIEVSYLKIALMNVIPALIYFIFVIMMVDLEALRSGLKGLPAKEIPKVSEVLKNGWHFFLPIVIVLGLLFYGFSPEVGAFWGTMSAFLLSWRRKNTRMKVDDVLVALRSGSSANNSAGAAIGALGIIIGGIVLSGLGLKFSAILVEVAAGSLLLCVDYGHDHFNHNRDGEQHDGIIYHSVSRGGTGLDPSGGGTGGSTSGCFLCSMSFQHHAAGLCVGICGRSTRQSGPNADRFCRLEIRLCPDLSPLRVCLPATVTVWVDRHSILVYTVITLLLGFMALAMVLQGADFINSRISCKDELFSR